MKYRWLIFFGLLALGSGGYFMLKNSTQSLNREGKRLYRINCANCHMDDGSGLSALIPPLANADFLAQNRDKLPCYLRHGLQDTIVVNGKTYAEQMPGVEKLSYIDITNLLNYINTNWGNHNPPYHPEDVRDLLVPCEHHN